MNDISLYNILIYDHIILYLLNTNKSKINQV